MLGTPPTVAPRPVRSARRSRFTAASADRHLLYQLSVQSVDAEAAFLDRAHRRLVGRRAVSLREDFCGTALLCAEWVRKRPERRATGVDIDPSVLAWGREHNLAPLGDRADRVTLVQADVRAPHRGVHDVIVAFNYSYWIFRTRDELRDYFAGVRRALAPRGLFFCDAYGGTDAMDVLQESRRIRGGFTYVWEQARFNPIDHDVLNHIHFEFGDGSRMDRAFTYAWRFWTLPELQELLREAGFREVTVYWDRAEREGDESYRPTTRIANQPGWLAYLVAQR